MVSSVLFRASIDTSIAAPTTTVLSRGIGLVLHYTPHGVITVDRLLMPKHAARRYIANAGTVLHKLTCGSEVITVLSDLNKLLEPCAMLLCCFSVPQAHCRASVRVPHGG